MAGVAAAGVVLGHWLTYVLAIPEGRVRSQVLIRAGHSYWLFAVQAAVALGIVAVGSLVFRHLRSLTEGVPAGEERFSRVALRLAWLQVAGFTAMEAAERILSGASVGGMFQHHLFLIGLLIQVLVACGGAFVLLLLSRAAARLAAALHGTPHARAPARARWFERLVDLRPRVLAGAAGLRSPPSL
jgi:hypothetical protein